MQTINFLFWAILISIINLLFLSTLVTDGMFVDGLWYATISRNLSEGVGSFWQPQLSESLYPQFFEHPPLLFGIQSFFFILFGDHFWVERLYCLLIFILTGILILYLFKKLSGASSKYLLWLPLILWVLPGDVHRGYGNNLLESTMGLFDLVAILFLVMSTTMNRSFEKYWIIGGAVFIDLAFLTKGFPGLYPMAFYILYKLAFPGYELKRALINSFVLILITLIPISILYSYGESAIFFQHYFDQQVMAALEGHRTENIRGSRWDIILMLLQNIGLMLVIGFVLKSMLEKNLKLTFRSSNRYAILFILLGFAASLPLAISIKQASYYLIPSFACFAIGISLYFYPRINEGDLKLGVIGSNLLVGVAYVLIVASLTSVGLNLGKTDKRDRALISDIENISTQLTLGETTISIYSPRGLDNYAHGYFMRKHHISLDTTDNDHQHLIVRTKDLKSIEINKYEVTEEFPTLTLFKLKSN